MKTFARTLALSGVALLALLLLSSVCPASETESAPWWDADWQQRYRVEFPPATDETGGEIGVVTFRADMGNGTTPYDIRAVHADATTAPVTVLNWTPDAEGLANRGMVKCLVGIEACRKSAESPLFFYMANPAAPPEFSDYAWRNPTLLIGDHIERGARRHGEWTWRADPRFSAVHVASSPSDASRRVSHSVTGLSAVSLHPTRTRLVQMVWIDPVSPPEAISLDMVFDRSIRSVYWTDAEEPPEDTIATRRAKIIDPLPELGKWVRLEVTTGDFTLRMRSLLRGIGFSNHGGTVRWGPTAIGAMPIFGQVTMREAMTRTDDGAIRIEALPVLPLEPEALPEGSLRLDLVRAPLFAEPGKPLSLTCFVSPSHKFIGPLPDRTLHLVAIHEDATEQLIGATAVTFVGGDNWQRALDIPPSGWAGASSIEARLLEGDQAVAVARLRLEPLGPVDGLEANGTLLQAGNDYVAFHLARRQPLTANSAGSATLIFAPSGKTRDTTHASGSDAETVSVCDGDPRLGLAPRVSMSSRRTAAEWVVAASRLSAGGEFRRATIVVDRDLLDLGLTLQNAGLFLAGLIELLQTCPDIEVTLDCEQLRDQAKTPRERALLVKALEAKPLVRTTQERAKP